MGFNPPRNIAAINSHMYAQRNNQGLDKSLSALSSGLRINTAADDASGLSIANSLKAQANGLGQSIRNANDGIAVMQSADGALDEYTNILNTVRTKAIQASSDGQNEQSRKAIQADITKLLKEADNIAKTTSFNGQNLLDGTFQNKSFHIGAYQNETIDITVSSTKTSEVGGIKAAVDNGVMTTALAGSSTALQVAENGSFEMTKGLVKINGIDISEQLNSTHANHQLDSKNVADAISKATGVTATAETTIGTLSGVSAASLTAGDTLKINGVSIGTVTVLANDSDGSLVQAINNISDQTGVTAKMAEDNQSVILTASDGKNISLDATGTEVEKLNFVDTTTTVSGSVVTALVSTTAAKLELKAGDLIINGIDMAGTYGDGTVGSSAEAFKSALKAIDGLDQSSVNAAGSIVIKSNDGTDVNIRDAAGGTSAFTTALQGIHNSSTKGEITLYSDESIRVESDVNVDNVLSFSAGVIITNMGDDRLDTIDVTSREGAELAILIVDQALQTIDSIRSTIGSTQNQLDSTVRNISVTQVNVTSAESQIRDVDFALESANLKKHSILAQAGTYALSQANAAQENISTLLR